MRRSLIHFWRMNLAVVAGAAVATAVLTGSLLVGDSLRGSLRQLTLERLGRVDLALTAPRLFPAEVADRLSAAPGFGPRFASAVPAIALRASGTHAATRARASRLNLYGVDERFWGLFGGVPETASSAASGVFPGVAINGALQRELGAEVGDALLVSFESADEVPHESLMGSRDSGAAVETLRLTVTAILADRGVGRFALAARHASPLNAFVELSEVQRRLGPGGANALLVSRAEGATPDVLAGDDTAALGQLLRSNLTASDLGYRVRRRDGHVSLDSSELVLRPEVARQVDGLANEARATAQRLLVYLANEMAVGEHSVPYSTVAALELPAPPVGGGLFLIDGTPAPALAPGEILLNRWTADDLGAAAGDELEMTYYVVGPRDELITERRSFVVAGVVAMDGLGADPDLTPEAPGIAEAEDIAAWDPPFPVELERIRSQDEDYWDLYRGAPKAFVGLGEGRKLWRSRFGDLTSIRLAPPPGQTVEALAAELETGLVERAPLASLGLTFEPVKQRGLEAASGTTDFSGLFIGFSLFLIVSACLLVGLLFGLLVERRAPELGVRLAIGFPPRRVRRQLLAEGTLLATLGAFAGLGLAVVYARAVLAGLRSWWAPLVDSPFLEFHGSSTSLGLGMVLSIGLVVLSIVLSFRRLRRAPVRSLLAGWLDRPEGKGRGRWPLALMAGGSVTAVALLAAALAGDSSSPALFFGVGAALCLTGLAGFALWCRRPRGRLPAAGRAAYLEMAARSSARNPGRSLLSVALVGCASFVLVSVSANRQELDAAALGRDSGTGGFALVAESDVPLRQPPVGPRELRQLGLQEEEIGELAGLRLLPFRLLPGDDASCLSLYQPETPRILGVPPELVERGGFRFRSMIEDTANPWELLDREMEPGVVPAIGDFNSVTWILHRSLGEDLVVENDRGEEIRLRLVALLETSIFQSELLVSQESFLRHFPDHGGFSFFLGETAPESTALAAQALERGLAPFGLDAGSTVARLAGYRAVEEMYLTTFQALGGFGLLLGTLGLGVVLARNVIERRGELATLRAFGFRRSTLAWLVVGENGFLLLVGLAVGGFAGFLAAAPHLAAAAHAVPWRSLLLTLAAVLVAGLASSLVAVVAALRAPLLPVLKAE